MAIKTFYTEKSKRISSLEYDDKEETLTVQFIKGGEYKYHGVPEEIYLHLVAAQSLGKAFNESVRGQYGFTKLS